MEVRIKLMVDEEAVLDRCKVILEKMKATLYLRGLGVIIVLPLFLTMLFRIYVSRHYITLPYLVYIGLTILAGVLLWFCFWGYKVCQIHMVKVKMKKEKYPKEYELFINENEIEVITEALAQKFKWDFVEYICESDRYWLLVNGTTMLIDKEAFTPEQYQFVKMKCDAVKVKKKWL